MVEGARDIGQTAGLPRGLRDERRGEMGRDGDIEKKRNDRPGKRVRGVSSAGSSCGPFLLIRPSDVLVLAPSPSVKESMHLH